MAYNLKSTDGVNQLLQDFVDKFAGSAGDKAYEIESGETSHRYRSWEYCRKAFLQHKDDEVLCNETIDYLALNLAFYLASWGMYRGSSFLLNLDYTVHRKIVEIVMKKEYKELFDSDNLIFENREHYLDLLFGVENKTDKPGIVIEFSKEYAKWRDAVRNNSDSAKGMEDEDQNKEIDISNVLITKVLMGVFGCVPAYDRFFTDGLKTQKINSQFRKNGVRNLLEYVCDNGNLQSLLKNKKEEIERDRKIRFNEKADSDSVYTFMKMVDMIFWEIGTGYVVTITKENKNSKKMQLTSEEIKRINEIEDKILEKKIEVPYDSEEDIKPFKIELGEITFESDNIGSLIMCIYDYFNINENNKVFNRKAVKEIIKGKKKDGSDGLEWQGHATTRYSKRVVQKKK